jgi:hypothetical protein
MSRLHVTLGVFLLILSAFSLAAQTPGTATVSGRVTLKGEPAHDVVVALYSERMSGGGPNPGLRSTTGEDGAFKFTGLKAGRYTVGALAPGFVSTGDNSDRFRGKSMNLSEGENLENLTIVLTAGAVIAGRVSDGDDRPLVDQVVNLTPIDERGNSQERMNVPQTHLYRTDDRGRYRLFGLPAGRYLVSVGFETRGGTPAFTSNRSYYPRTYHPDAGDRAQAKIILLEEGGVVEEVDIKVADLKSTYDVFGRVESSDGKPAAGVKIAYGMIWPGGKGVSSFGGMGIVSDAQGKFQIPNVLPGKYAVFAQKEKGDEFYTEPTPFEIKDEDASGLVIKLTSGASISGAVVIEGGADPAKLSSLGVQVITSSEGVSLHDTPSTKLRPDGGFQFVGIKPGIATFYVGGRSESERYSILRIEHNGAMLADDFRIGSGERLTGLRIVVAIGTSVVRGQVRLPGGEKPEDVNWNVYAIRSGTKQQSYGEIDSRGQFVIQGLIPGEYEIKLHVYFPEGLTPERTKWVEMIRKLSQTVSVVSGQETRVTIDVSTQQPPGER